MIDKKKIKEKLEKERDVLLEELRDMGTLNPTTGDWEAVPEEQVVPEADQNDMADRFENFESRSSMMKALVPRLTDVLKAIKNVNKESFGRCAVCKEDIEHDRLEANPAARNCKEHMED
ncbi:MAG: hypothetical protein KBD17_01365 [Candidatus Pacebacteria bacterium]|nr:hypothetical protein [Candidatus Paceibacterota bacterium]